MKPYIAALLFPSYFDFVVMLDDYDLNSLQDFSCKGFLSTSQIKNSIKKY
jgi:hypothetical protein